MIAYVAALETTFFAGRGSCGCSADLSGRRGVALGGRVGLAEGLLRPEPAATPLRQGLAE